MHGAVDGDRIEVRGLRVDGVHGVLEQERMHAQPFEVDLDLYLDTVPAARATASPPRPTTGLPSMPS